MKDRHGIHNRRHDSPILPRIYLMLQIVILLLGTYIVSVILLSLGMNEIVVYMIAGVVNSYLLINYFFRCKYVAHRNRYAQRNSRA